MSGIVQQTLPSAEPVLLGEMKLFLKINTTGDDALIPTLITAARGYIEDSTGLLLAPRTFLQTLDGFPSFPYIPGYGLVPSISSGFPFAWNYPTAQQGTWMARRNPYEVRLMAWPVTKVDHITYVGPDSNPATIQPGTDFVVDLVSKPARVSPLPGGVWPTGLMFTNSVAIFFTAGFDTNPTTITDDIETPPTPPGQIVETKFASGITETLRLAIKLLVAHWYFNREPVSVGQAGTVPHSVDAIISQARTYDFNPLVNA